MRAFQVTLLLLLIAAALLLGLALSLRGEDAGKVEAKCKARCLKLHGRKAADHLLNFSILYVTASRADDCTARDPGGAKVPLRKFAHFAIGGDGERFSAELPLDTFSGGRCDWRAQAMYFDVTSARNREALIKGGRSLLTFTSGNAAARTVNLECQRATIRDPKKKTEVRYGCVEASDAPPLRLGDGSHTVEINFR